MGVGGKLHPHRPWVFSSEAVPHEMRRLLFPHPSPLLFFPVYVGHWSAGPTYTRFPFLFQGILCSADLGYGAQVDCAGTKGSCSCTSPGRPLITFSFRPLTAYFWL